MFISRLIRRFRSWRSGSVFGLGLLALALLAVPSAEGVAGQSAATRAALAAFHGHAQSEHVIVFALHSPLPPGTVISAGGSGEETSGATARSRGAWKVRLARRSWFFYEDLAPYEPYAHAGVVALVNVRTGHTRSISTVWPPVIDGSLPIFLRNQAAYDGGRYRVYSGSYPPGSASGPRPPASATLRFDRSRARTVARLLADGHACVVSLADTLPGGYFDAARVGRTAGWLDGGFSRLSSLDSGFASAAYSGGADSPIAFIKHQLSTGCRDMLVYLGGGAYENGTAVNIGMRLDGGSVVHQDVTERALRGLAAGHPGVHFEFVVDAPHSSGFQALSRLKNVLMVATPRAPAKGSFAYLPQVLVGRRMLSNDTDPLHLLELTNSLGVGLARVIDSSAEVAQLQTVARSHKVPSALAYLLARGFARGSSADFPVQAHVALAPLITLNGFKAPRPSKRPAVTARPDSYSTSADSTLSVDASHGVLANDSDSRGFSLSVDGLNGKRGKAPLDGMSAKGAAVRVNADGSFTYDPSGSSTLQALPSGQSTTDTFTYRADDGHGGTGTATVQITVSGPNRPPVLANIEGSTLQYAAGSPAVSVTSSLTASDPDDSNLAGATVSISSGFVSSEDVLHFSDQNGITGSYDASTGVLTLSGSASLADYQAALRSVSYRDSNGTTPTTGTRTISFQVDDGQSAHNQSNTVSRDINVEPNAAPTASDDAASTDKGRAIDIPVLANDSDSDGDSLSVSSVDTTGTKGTVSINSDGTIHYDPSGQFSSLQGGQSATDTFTYKASDGYQDSNSATVTVTINGANSPPVLSSIESSAVSYDAGTSPTQVTSTLTVSDPDDTNLQAASVKISSGFVSSEDSLQFTDQNGITGNYDSSTGVLGLSGSASLADYQAALRSVTFSDSNGSSPSTGTRTISFQADDGQSANNLSNVESRDITVNSNPSPTANDDSASTGKHTPIDINVLANDSDPDGETLSVASLDTTGTKGSVSVNADGTIHYDPNGQFDSLQDGQSATDTFTYKASDGYQDSSPATVTVTIDGSNDAPVLSNIESSAVSYDAGTTPTQVTSTLTVSDDDDTDLAGATVQVSSGFVSGEDSLQFTNQNGITGSYDSSTGVLTLTGSASPADYQAALESVSYSDSDGANPSTGTRTISFQVDDGHSSNNLSNTVSRDITVNPNPSPSASDDSASTDKHTAIDIPVLSNDSDSDGDTLSVASVDTTGTKGIVSVNSEGTIHYDPNGQFESLQAGQSATDTFTYRASDGYHDSNSATVTVTINGSNDPPVLSNIESSAVSYYAGAPAVQVTGAVTVSDPDDATLQGATVSISSGFVASEDSLQFTDQNGISGDYDASTGVLTLSGAASLADYQAAFRSVGYMDINGATPSTGTRTISFQVDDGHSANNLSNIETRDITVKANAAPTANDDSASTDKNTAIDIPVLGNDSDPDGDPVSVASVDTTGTKGTVSVNPDGTIHYDPNGQFQSLQAGQSATDTFTYKDSDGYQQSNSATVTVTINGVNDPPVLSNMETTAVSYRAQDPGTQITSTLAISSDDASQMSDATVSITSGFDSGNDQLQFTNQNGITGNYDSSTGVLTLSGDATISDYQSALRSIDFYTSDSSASPASRTVSFSVTDSLGASSTSSPSRTIDVSEANQAPTAGNVSYSAVGNTPLGVGTTPSSPSTSSNDNLLNHASDSDSSDPVSITAHTNPSHGTLTWNGDGTFTYEPNAGYSGADTFTYTVTDSDDSQNPKSATGTVTINVGTVVWYVDDSKTQAGTGQSTAPFNTLAAANTALGANSIVFLYQGNSTYTGGLSLKSGDELYGQPHGLTVSGNSLVTAGGSNPTITNSEGDGIDLGEGSDVEAIDISSPSANGVAASSVNSATVGGSNAVGISGAGGDGIHISGGNSNLDFANTTVTGSTGHSLSISSHTGGTASFGGTISDSGKGISLTGNTGTTINLSGKLTISSGTNPGLLATGGGTVTANASGNTIASTTGDALDVENTTIGSSGLDFQSISSNGAANGIKLSSTGSSGSLTVSGTGSAGSGGTIQSSTGDGVSLSSTSSPSFTDMVIKNNANSGIHGTSVAGFSLAGATVSGNGSSTGTAGDFEDGLNFGDQASGTPTGLTGTATITNSTISNSADNNMQVTDNSGSLTLTVTGSTFSTTGTNEHTNAGMQLIENGTVGMTASVTGSTFTNSHGYQFDFATGSGDTATNSLTFSNNTLSDNAPNAGGNVEISPGTSSQSGTTTLDVKNNTITGAEQGAISLGLNGGSGTLSGTISANTVGSPSVACSGSYAGNDISASANGSSTVTLAITNNKLYQYDNVAGIDVVDGQGSPTMNMTITGNTIADPVGANTTCTGNGGAEGALWGLVLNSGTQNGDAGTVCAEITGNSMTGSAPSAANGGIDDFEFDENDNGIFKLPGYTGGSTDSNAVVSYVQNNNNSSGAPSGDTFILGSGQSGGYFFNTASCPTPST
jgi:VCBS repeat-containing protein